MKLFPPPDGPAWLPPILRRIVQAMAEPWDSPVRLQKFATADLPDATAWTGGIVYDVTTAEVKRSNGTIWASVGGSGGVSDGDKGDVVVSGGGTVWTIDAGVVTLAKQADIATSRIMGRVTAGAGVQETLTAAQVKTLLALASTDISDFTEASQDVIGAMVAAAGGSYNDGAGTITFPSSGSATTGTTVVDFGAFPGASDTSATVTGQTGILAGSRVKAWIEATATSDHSADEHWLETIDVRAGNISVGTGFKIYAKNTGTLSEPTIEQWASTRLAGPGTGNNQIRPDIGGGKGTRLYGQFTVGWEWI